jgi:3-isopropylmalate dehydrogenase
MNRRVEIALVRGDGSGPELMDAACRITAVAAKKYNDLDVVWVETPMGWSAFDEYGDTYPEPSRKTVKRCGIVFFGGVGNPELDDTLGEQHPGMKPEGRCLLGLREDLGLLVNGRPLTIPYDLRHATKIRPEFIPKYGIQQWWMRYLLEDGYFGTRDLIGEIPPDLAKRLGIRMKADVTGGESRLSEFAYYSRARIEKYARYGFDFAKRLGMRVINIHKSNILARSLYWQKIIDEVREEAYGDVPYKSLYVDAAASMLYQPAIFNAVMLCGNEHGDIISDAALGAFSMGMMSSFAINPETGQGMFESGAGTCPELAGMDVANPIGRILTGALMFRYGNIAAPQAADAIESAVWQTLKDGWRTRDIASKNDHPKRIVGTKQMGDLILEQL